MFVAIVSGARSHVSSLVMQPTSKRDASSFLAQNIDKSANNSLLFSRNARAGEKKEEIFFFSCLVLSPRVALIQDTYLVNLLSPTGSLAQG